MNKTKAYAVIRRGSDGIEFLDKQTIGQHEDESYNLANQPSTFCAGDTLGKAWNAAFPVVRYAPITITWE